MQSGVDTRFEQLESVARFLSTVLVAGQDPFASVASCRFWLADRGHPSPTAGEAARELLLELRTALRQSVSAGGPPPASTRSLSGIARRAGLTVRFRTGDDGLSAWELAGPPGAPAYAAEMLSIVMRALDDGSWGRLRICPGKGCGVAFVDRTRATRRTWCSMARCGNRAKQARWRSANARSAQARTPSFGASG